MSSYVVEMSKKKNYIKQQFYQSLSLLMKQNTPTIELSEIQSRPENQLCFAENVEKALGAMHPLLRMTRQIAVALQNFSNPVSLFLEHTE